MEGEDKLRWHPQESLPPPLRQHLSLACSSPVRLIGSASPREPFISASLTLRWHAHGTTASIFMWVLGIALRPSCLKVLSKTDPSPQPTLPFSNIPPHPEAGLFFHFLLAGPPGFIQASATCPSAPCLPSLTCVGLFRFFLTESL